MDTRKVHDNKGQPPETVGKQVRVWFEDDLHEAKDSWIDASEVDWCHEDAVLFYGVKP